MKEMGKYKRAKSLGRPPKALWPDMIEEMAKIQCTMNEMAACLGCERGIIEDDEELMQRIKQGRERGLMELRRAQYKKAVVDQSPALQIWLGKNMLAQSDAPQVDKKTAQSAFERWLENGSDESEESK